jgi:hypothetical protein
MADPEDLVARAAAQLDAYERACHASLVQREGLPRPPVLHLSDEALAALFAPKQKEVLVHRPLFREGPRCQDKK